MKFPFAAAAGLAALAATAARAHPGHGVEGPMHLVAEHPILVVAAVAGLAAAGRSIARRLREERKESRR